MNHVEEFVVSAVLVNAVIVKKRYEMWLLNNSKLCQTMAHCLRPHPSFACEVTNENPYNMMMEVMSPSRRCSQSYPY